MMSLSLKRSTSLNSSRSNVRPDPLESPFRRNPLEPRAPITPPMSPRSSEESLGDVVMKTDCTCDAPASAVLPSSEWRETEDMDAQDPQSASPPRQAIRLLEDETSHVEQPGTLRLTDFEVKGTLGETFPSISLPRQTLTFSLQAPALLVVSCSSEDLPHPPRPDHRPISPSKCCERRRSLGYAKSSTSTPNGISCRASVIHL